MPILSKENAVGIALSAALFKSLKFTGIPSNVSLLIASSFVSWTSFINEEELQFLLPFIFSPIIKSKIRQFKVTEAMYSLCMGYIVWIWCFDHQQIPKKFCKSLDSNCGMKRDVLAGFRKKAKEFQWIPIEYTTQYFEGNARKGIIVKCLKSLAINIGKLMIFQTMVQIVVSRRLNNVLTKNTKNWCKTVLFLFIAFQTAISGPVQYNKYIRQNKNSKEVETVESYRPKHWMMYLYFSLCSFLAIQVESTHKRPIVASYLLLQSIMTVLNKNNIKTKPFLPALCFMFLQIK